MYKTKQVRFLALLLHEVYGSFDLFLNPCSKEISFCAVFLFLYFVLVNWSAWVSVDQDLTRNNARSWAGSPNATVKSK